jgi:parallel beta-helix repeat protein
LEGERRGLEKKSVSVIVLILLLIGVLTVAFNINPLRAEPGTIYVDDDNTGGFWDGSQDHPYQNITSALEHALVDDTIYVYNGVYRENVVIDKTLTLMGESRSNTIINGSGLSYEGALVAIAAANNVDISGFTVTNALHQGINAEESWYCVVHDTIVCFTGEGDGDRGIVFGGGGNNSAYNNVVYNSTGFGGIEAIYSNNNTICNNVAYFNQWGIATNHGSYNRIYNNTVHSNRGAGINIDWPSTGNIVRNNNVSSNTNDGIRVINQNETVISGNRISENDCGIFLESSPNNTIYGNYITNNAVAVTIVSSENNSFYHNNFINNGWQVIIDMYASFWDDGYPHGGNYWSDYTGVDLYSGPHQNETGSDGIGDVPYVINANNTDNYPLMRALYYESGMTQVVSTESTYSSGKPSLAVDLAGNVHVAWHDGTDYAGCGTDIDIFYKSFVVGEGWTPTVVVSTNSTADSYFPSLAVDSGGNIHIAWCDYTDLDSGTDIDIFYKSFVVGEGWTPTVVVSTNSTDDSSVPSLAVDSGGNVHIAWYDWTNYTGCGTDADIFYRRYEVGSGWTATEVISTESTYSSLDPSLAVDSGGNIHIAWEDYTDLGSGIDVDIFYKSFVVGEGWTPTVVVSTNSTDDSSVPSLAVDSGGNVHIAWYDATDYAGCGSDWDIFYKRFVGGSGWTTTTVVSTESTAFSRFPSLAVDLAGNVHVAWYDVTDLEGESDAVILYKRYEVGSGLTNTTVVSKESPNASRMPSLAVDSAGNVHVAWEDYTNYGGCGSDYDIFYKYLRLHFTQYPWPMFHHDLRHTGYTESPAPNTNQTLWNYTTDGLVESSPVVVDGVVFVGSNDGNVYALDQHTGAKIWNFTTGSAVHSSPAVAYGKVYVAAFDHKVFCLDAATGEHIWNYTTGGWMRSSPAVVDGKVYVGSDGGGVYCLNASTKTQIWNCPIGSWTYTSSPAVAYGRVYVGSVDGKVHCIDAATGAPIWNYTTDGWVVSSPAVAYGKIYVGSYDNKVYCLDAVTKELIWNYTALGDVHSSPAVAYGKIYVGSADGRVYCLNASTRAQIWNFTTGSAVYSSPAVADGKVYVGSFDNKTYCLDASTGVSIWNFTTGGNVYSSPAVADGMVFVGSNDNTTYAFGNVIRVPEDYPTVQEAIDAADPWATIIIAPGTYNESIIIDRPLTIIGGKGSSTDFAGGGSGIAVTILPAASGTIVTNIVITNWDQGIFIDDASDCKIYDNIMYLMNDTGIVLEGNNAANNLIDSNTIYSNNIAIDLTESSTTNTIYNNTISLNNIGLNLESSGNTIYANIISENAVGINMTNSNDNTIYWNNFIDNTYTQVCTSNSSNNIWDNGLEGNYWSNYAGTDDDGDGIGDTPHVIDENNQDNHPLMSPYEYWSNPILGDINKDMKVNHKDLSHLAATYGSTSEKPNWNSNCDFNGDGKVDASDLFDLSKNYGKTI